MKKLLNISLIIALLVSATSCKKSYLDINTNPNTATAATPEVILPAALTSTASLMITYLDYGNWMVGYQSNAGGYSYTGSTTITYAFTTGSNTGLWTGAFSNLRDYNYIITNTTGIAKYTLYNGVARIMKAYTYQKLVDEYGDVPYSEALLGQANFTPKYDNQATVYQALVTDIDAAIVQLRANAASTTVTKLTTDVMLGGDVTKWIQFANNIKLRILTRARLSSISAFVNTEFTTFGAEGFLTSDVLIDPGYSSSSSIQNPIWNTYFSDFAGNLAGSGRSRIPTPWIMSFYNGNKLTDGVRGALTYKNFGSTPVNQLGIESGPTAIANYPAWYIGTGTAAKSEPVQGIIKSRVMGMPIFPASETYFLLAEAALHGYTLSGDAVTNFNAGITASFNYLKKLGATNAPPAGSTADAADVTAYKAANPTSYLTNYALATSDEQRLEAIITQKYIALNFIDGYEAWTEFRRTGFPRITIGSTAATATFASTQSTSPRTDRLTVRSLYPQTEINLNTNTPTGISVFTTKIFWDPTAETVAN